MLHHNINIYIFEKPKLLWIIIPYDTYLRKFEEFNEEKNMYQLHAIF